MCIRTAREAWRFDYNILYMCVYTIYIIIYTDIPRAIRSIFKKFKRTSDFKGKNPSVLADYDKVPNVLILYYIRKYTHYYYTHIFTLSLVRFSKTNSRKYQNVQSYIFTPNHFRPKNMYGVYVNWRDKTIISIVKVILPSNVNMLHAAAQQSRKIITYFL